MYHVSQGFILFFFPRESQAFIQIFMHMKAENRETPLVLIIVKKCVGFFPFVLLFFPSLFFFCISFSFFLFIAFCRLFFSAFLSSLSATTNSCSI
uniref:Transmembrane protein n=1 Tax=Triticum urartu TaxID=4572 RepID=A0A8R7PUY3_TRIUA